MEESDIPNQEQTKQKPLFVDLNPDDDDQNISEIESLCLNCHEQGTTRLLLTRIPFFREIIVSSFQCDHCHHNNRDIQYGGQIQDRGVKYQVKIQNPRDLNRQVIKSDTATFAMPSLEFEQPATKKGEINTVEGLIEGVIAGLQQEQPIRKSLYPDVAEKIEAFIQRLDKLKTLAEPFTIVVDDPSGNSFIENPLAPKKDDAMQVEYYTRTDAQEKELGLKADDDEWDSEEMKAETEDREVKEQENNRPDTATDSTANAQDTNDEEESKDKSTEENLKDEVLSFATNCHNCSSPCQTNMKLVEIPFFKQVIIMATNCDACGIRDNEVKGGAGIADKATKITLHVTDPSDLCRDVLKSDTCAVQIPEIELELMEGTLGGKFTTIEGLLQQIKTELYTKNPFLIGDGAADDTKQRLQEFSGKLDKLIAGGEFTLILDDAAGNSYLQNVYAPDDDPEMTVEHYTRSREQDDSLGLLEMRTENYNAPEHS